MSERWEQERGSWVLARAGRRPGARRRGEKLLVSARRHDRYEVGAGDAAYGEVTTRNLFYRAVTREEGAANVAGWFCLAVICSLAVTVLVGPALLISRVAYGIWWWRVPRWGRMSPWPYLGLAAVLGGIAWLVLSRLTLAGFEGFLWWYGAAQLVLGMAWAAWLVRARGWAAVARRQKQSGSAVERVVIEVPADEPTEPVVVEIPQREPAAQPDTSIEPIEVGYIEDEHEDLPGEPVTTTSQKEGTEHG